MIMEYQLQRRVAVPCLARSWLALGCLARSWQALGCLALLCLCSVGPATAQRALPMEAVDEPVHEHGSARLEIAVHGNVLELRLRAPLDSVLGFETSTRTRKQRQAVKSLALQLHRSPGVFVPSPPAQCNRTRVALTSVVLDPALLTAAPDVPSTAAAAGGTQPAGRAEAGGSHNDLDVEVSFECLQPQSLTGLQVKLFETFPALLRIDVDIVTPRGQSGARLSPNRAALTW
jgi:hypothetical protein